jgi:PAS domain S-box-containing protein
MTMTQSQNLPQTEHDITARLLESERRYRDYIENASDMIQSVRADGRFEFVNPAWLRKLGYTAEEVPDLTIWDIIDDSSVEHCQAFFMLVMGGQKLDEVTAVFKTKDGVPVPVEGDATPRIVDGQVVATHSFFRDIRERLRARELEERNAKLERENMARSLEKMAALGKLSAGLSHELNNPAAAAQRASDQLADCLSKRDASARSLVGQLSEAGWDTLTASLAKVHAAPAGELDALAISDQEMELEEWLEGHGVDRAWEMSSRMVKAGITPEILSELADELPAKALVPAIGWLGESVAARELTDVVGRSVSRISQLVGAVKSYSHMDRATELYVDVHDGIEDTLIIMGHRFKDVSVRRSYDRSLPPIRALGNSLNQVWTNIIDNAIDASDGRGTVTIGTRREGDDVVVSFEDNGCGIAEENLEHIFEPFFSTKAQGYGTGLGLDTVWRIVNEEHGGKITVDSRPGRTVFSIRLPLAEGKRA